MTRKLIVSDMDQTFLTSEKTFDKDLTKRVFKELLGQGHILAIASGNPHVLLESYFAGDLADRLYFAGDNGNILMRAGEILQTVAPDREIIGNIFTDFVDRDGFFPVLSTGERAYAHEALNEEALKEIQVYYKEVLSISSFEDFPEDETAIKVDILSDFGREDNKKMVKYVEETYDHVSAVTSDEHWLDVYSDQGGKGQAVESLQQRYGIDKANTLCFGDSMNDQPMMDYAGYAIAMENADPELVDYCNFQIGTNEDQSVQKVLAQFAKEGNLDFMEEFGL